MGKKRSQLLVRLLVRLATSLLCIVVAGICSIANATQAQLTLTHTVINDAGGTAVPTDFFAYANGITTAWDVTHALTAGDYSVVISALAGYESSHWQGDCAADGSISLAIGQIANCHIVSNDMGVDLVISKTVSDASPNIEQVVTFSLLVNNLGPDSATNVKVVDVVASGLEYQAGTISGAGNFSDVDPYVNGLQWVIPTVPVGVPVTLTFDAKILAP